MFLCTTEQDQERETNQRSMINSPTATATTTTTTTTTTTNTVTWSNVKPTTHPSIKLSNLWSELMKINRGATMPPEFCFIPMLAVEDFASMDAARQHFDNIGQKHPSVLVFNKPSLSLVWLDTGYVFEGHYKWALGFAKYLSEQPKRTCIVC
jgi:hypothetical protein